MTLTRQKAWHFETEYGGLDYTGKVVLDIGAEYGCSPEFFLSRGAAFVVASEWNDAWRAELEAWAEGKPVSVVGALDETNAEALIRATRPDIIKCDCEGCETHLLNVPDAVLSIPDAWVMETHTLALYEAFTERFEALGYRVKVVKDFGPKPNRSGKVCKVIQAER